MRRYNIYMSLIYANNSAIDSAFNQGNNPTQPKFYNLYYANNTASTIPLILDSELNIPILKKPSDYDVSIVRFSLPAFYIYMFKFPQAPAPGKPDLRFYLTMKYQNQTVSLPVQYDYSIGDINGGIWEVQEFISMLNDSFKSIYQALNLLVTLPNTYTTVTPTFTTGTNTFTLATHGFLNGDLVIVQNPLGSLQAKIYFVINATTNTFQVSLTKGGAVVTGDTTGSVNLSAVEVPYFKYSETEQLVSLVTNKNYYMTNLNNPIYLGMNEILLRYLQGFVISATTPTISPPYWFVIMDTHNNISGEYITMKQEAFYFSNWIDFDSIVITTTMPIANEYQGSDIALPVLSDFTPSEVTLRTFHEPIIYNTVTPYRQYSIISDSPLYSIKCYCYTSTASGELRQILVGPGQSANVKLMFTPKKTNKYS